MKQANAKNFIQILDSLNRDYKANRGGYHQQAYDLMAKALYVALLLRSNKKLRRKFIRHVKPKSEVKGDSASFNIVTEVMVYVMGATSDSNRKLAWRRGRVIEFLHDQGIKVEKISSEIQSRGGIGAVLKQATKENPRRDKGSTGRKTGVKKSAGVISKSKSDLNMLDREESDTTIARSAGATGGNDGQVIMLLPVLIKLSDRDMLEELRAESRVRIVGTRINHSGAKIEVNRVKKLKPGLHRLEDDSEWA